MGRRVDDASSGRRVPTAGLRARSVPVMRGRYRIGGCDVASTSSSDVPTKNTSTGTTRTATGPSSEELSNSTCPMAIAIPEASNDDTEVNST